MRPANTFSNIQLSNSREHPTVFVTDLQLVIGMLKYRSQKNELIEYVNKHMVLSEKSMG